jgi:hypothetical protein
MDATPVGIVERIKEIVKLDQEEFEERFLMNDEEIKNKLIEFLNCNNDNSKEILRLLASMILPKYEKEREKIESNIKDCSMNKEMFLNILGSIFPISKNENVELVHDELQRDWKDDIFYTLFPSGHEWRKNESAFVSQILKFASAFNITGFHSVASYKSETELSLLTIDYDNYKENIEKINLQLFKHLWVYKTKGGNLNEGSTEKLGNYYKSAIIGKLLSKGHFPLYWLYCVLGKDCLYSISDNDLFTHHIVNKYNKDIEKNKEIAENITTSQIYPYFYLPLIRAFEKIARTGSIKIEISHIECPGGPLINRIDIDKEYSENDVCNLETLSNYIAKLKKTEFDQDVLCNFRTELEFISDSLYLIYRFFINDPDKMRVNYDQVNKKLILTLELRIVHYGIS